MRLTTKGRYAITALIDLALHQGGGAIPLSDIAARQDIPISYLGHLFARMSKGGLVNAQRGPGGGYRLAKSSDRISLSDIIAVVEERIDNTRCGGQQNCQNNRMCLTHALWEDLNVRIEGMLEGISLSDVVTSRQVLSVAARQDRQAGGTAAVSFQSRA